MTALLSAAPSSVRRGSRIAGFLALAMTFALAAAGLLAPEVVLHGWLIAFVSFAGLGLGSVAWLAIHALTGGRWGDVARPTLLRTAVALPVAAVLVLPVIVADRWLYPWASHPEAAGAGVTGLYLNTGGLAVRSLVLLGGLSLVGWRARTGTLGRLVAALGLLLYSSLMSLAAFDWLLSLEPRYTSSAFGMQIIVAQLLSALCLVTLAADAPRDDPVWGDYGSFLLAVLLGESYIVLMTFVVHWYGNLPDQAAWYLVRSRGGWRWFEVAATLIGAVGPGIALLFGRIRHSPPALRVVAFAVLAGVLAQNVWLVAPRLGPDAGWAILAGVAASVACGGLMLVVALRFASTTASHGVQHDER